MIIIAITASWTVFLVSTIVGLFLFTTHYEVILNKREGYYKRSLNIIGIRFGKREKFEKILSCNILKGKFTDLFMVGPFGISTEGEMYHAFIEFSNGNLIQIGKIIQKSPDYILRKVKNAL